MTRIVRMLTVFFLLNLAATAQTSSFRSGFAVLELFTSESDANSPAGDAIFQEVIREARKAKQPVIGLAFHVDYWNGLGWPDRFANRANTDRQHRYAAACGPGRGHRR